ncbi:MAG: DAK2 domain-containing protein [Ruminococcaceae bacterium]|nr:DAK2 domain-containing protein [Oscillospiraceae bacterium]
MIERINGICYKNMIDYGVRNLEIHCDLLNSLNVFPVPDGDTGTNLVMTVKNGLKAIEDAGEDIAPVAKKFAQAIVFGARGNSGVISSQFFKGISEYFSTSENVDIELFSCALEKGVNAAYEAVAVPSEGTILTVIREATQAVKENLPEIESINDIVDVFLKQAKISLENTPELLPVLKDAGVVDSGGAGIVYFFEGVKKYLDGEELDLAKEEIKGNYVNYADFNRQSIFYGYCTECLIQLTDDKLGIMEDFDKDGFKEELSKLGDSVVTSFDDSKVRVHIHSITPEKVLEFCHKFGEFLSVKIENMSVQHTEKQKEILVAAKRGEYSFAVVAVAPDRLLGRTFIEMGADAVLISNENVSSEDYIRAMEKVSATEIFVFPNNANTVLAAMQAAKLYEKAKVTVIGCKDIAKCYSALAIIDYDEENIEALIEAVNDAISEVYTVKIAKSVKTMTYSDVKIQANDYIVIDDNGILAAGKILEETAWNAIDEAMKKDEKSIVNLFYGLNVSAKQLEYIEESIREKYIYTEVCKIPTEETIYDLSVSLE